MLKAGLLRREGASGLQMADRQGRAGHAAVAAAKATGRAIGAKHAGLGGGHALGQRGVEAGHAAVSEAPVGVSSAHQTAARGPAMALGVVGRLGVVHGLIAAREAHGLGVALLDLLRQQADLGAVVALVVVAVDRLPVVRLTDGLDVLLQPLVGEEAARLRRGRGRARQRAGALRDVREELGRLERIGLLLQKLVVESLILRLLGLLLLLTGGKLGLSPGEGRALSAGPQCGQLLRGLSASAVNVLAEAGQPARAAEALSVLLLGQRSLLLGCRRALPVKLLPEAGLRRGEAHALPVKLLAKRGLLLGCGQALPVKLLPGPEALRVSLLADAQHLARRLLQGGAVRLLGAQVHALLLLRGRQRLPVALVQDAGVGLSVRQLLLLRKVRGRQPGPVPAEGPGLDRIAKLAGQGLLVLLIQDALSALQDRPDIGRHELADLLPADLLGIHRSSARRRKPGSGHVVGLGAVVALRGIASASLLRGPEALSSLPIERLGPSVGCAHVVGPGGLQGRGSGVRAVERSVSGLRAVAALSEAGHQGLRGGLIVGRGRLLRAHESACGLLIVGLRLTGGGVGVGDPGLLRGGQRGHELAVVGLKGLGGSLLRRGVDGVITGQHFGGDRNLLC